MGQLKEELVLNSSKFDTNINNVIKKVEELKKKGDKVGDGFNSSMGKMIQKATGFNGSMGSLIGVVGKFSGALGIALSAGEAFNKTLNSSQTLTDKFGETQSAVNTIVDDFFQSLASGDFTPFLNGISSLISKAKEAYHTMDDLWNMAQSFSVQNARLNNQFQKNLNEIRAKKDSNNPEDKKRVQELVKQNQGIIETQAKGGAKLYAQTIKGLQDEIAKGTGMNTKVTEGAIYRIVENDINNLKSGRARYEKEYKEYQDRLKKLNLKADKDLRNGGMGRYGVNYTKEKNELEKKYGEAIAANYLLQKKSDEELAEFNNQLKQGILYEGQSIANKSKLLRYTKETNTSASGGKPSSTSNKVDYAVGSIGYYEELISSLQKKIKIETDTDKLLELQNQLKEAVRLKNRLEDVGFTKRQGEVGKNIQTTGLGTLFQVPNESAEDITKGLQDYLKEHPIQVDLNIDIYKTQKRIDAIGDSLYSLGSIMGSFGSMFESTILDASAILAQAVATYILGWTEATKKAGELGPIGWAAFGLSTAAQMFAVVAQIKAAGAFANGGVVGGSSYAGDALYARVNSGEAIINQNQQKHLFELLNSGANSLGGDVANVNFVIRGKDLHGCLHNYNSKMDKII